MATYTSVQDGPWNTPATWDLGVFPNTETDIVNIGHKVTWDRGIDTIAFNAAITVKINGMLILPVDSSWKMLFGVVGTLTINLGGEIRTGTAAAPDYLGEAFTGQMHFPQGAAVRNVFSSLDGAFINLWGANIYGPENRYAYLKANWTAGNTLYVTGDITSKTCWKAGNQFYIHDNLNLYVTDGYLLQGDIYTISSIGVYDAVNDKTPIIVTISSPARPCYAVSSIGVLSKLILISRNLELADPAALLDVGNAYTYTKRIRTNFTQTINNTKLYIKNCIFSGWGHALSATYNFQGTNLNFTSNGNGIYSGTNHQVTGDFTSNSSGIDSGTNHQVTGNFTSNDIGINIGTNHQVTGDFTSNSRGIYTGTNHQVTGNFTSNSRGINSGTNHQVTGDFTSNGYGIYSGTNHQVTGDFTSNSSGIDSGTNHQVTGNLTSNSMGINGGTNHQVTGDFTNTTNVSLANQTTMYSAVLEDSTISGADRFPLRIYQNSGNILPIISGTDFRTPPSINAWAMQAIPNSFCLMTFVNMISLSPLQEMAYIGEAKPQTLTFKIYPLVYTTDLTQDDVQLIVRYLDTATGITRATIINTGQTYPKDGWRDVSVTFTPAQSGVVYFNLNIGKYESGATILIDPIWVVS